ncbi:MAG: hypothetical protein JXA22_02410 [Candidatus Thermoplasmatota archaeon]|nr:hypothetical protein [Candidatus Thermoplasmatota archaeon]
MRTFTLYDPKVYSIVLFKPGKDKEKRALELLKTIFPNIQGIKCDPSVKEDMIVIELSMDIQPNPKGPVEVSPDLLKVKYEEMAGHRRSITDKLRPFVDEGCSIHHYTLFTCAGNDKIWLKTYSDISFLYKESEEDHIDLHQSNISFLNRIMTRSQEVVVNSIQHGKVSSMLYLLGHQQGRSRDMFPHDMVLEMDMVNIRTISTYGVSPIQVSASSPYGGDDQNEKKLYQLRQTYLINMMAVKAKLIEIFLVQSHLTDMDQNELQVIFVRGRELKEQFYQLQNNINDHMQLYSPSQTVKKRKKKEKDFLDRESFQTEKEHLTRASVSFSLVSEVEHQIMRYSSRMQEMDQKVSEISSSISLRAEAISIEGLSHTIGGITQRSIETIRRDLNSLLEELSHSRNILSSTIDVLRTFIDTRQREVSEEMSRLMNLLFLVFACIGLADALGNFVILAVEHIFFDDPTTGEVLKWSSMGLILTLLPLLIAVIFLVLFFYKKK